MRAAFRETIEGLLEGGVDVFWFETFSLVDHLAIAVEEARSAAADLPIVALLTFGEDVVLADGTDPAVAAAALAAASTSTSSASTAGPVRSAASTRSSRWAGAGEAILPNAGLPQRIEGQFVYAAPPDYFGRMVGDMLDAGAAIVGGCCGTTPEHIAAMRAAIDARVGRRRRAGRRPTVGLLGRDDPDRDRRRRPPMRRRRPRASPRALADGRYFISVEIDPPRSVRIERTIEAARLLQAAGVDTVNISDSAMARVRMGAWPWRSASSTTSISSASSTSRRATGT